MASSDDQKPRKSTDSKKLVSQATDHSFPKPSYPDLLILIAIAFSTYLIVGTICFYILRGQLKGKTTNGFIDAIYFCVVTMTTVGYGDLKPNTVLTKLLACLFTFSGMAIIALILTKAADYIALKQQFSLIEALHGTPWRTIDTKYKHKTKYNILIASIVLFVFVITGTVFLILIEGLDIVDAFYCVCSTISTLGYYDKSFSTVWGRIFGVVWILGSTLCLGQLFLHVAELVVDNNLREMVKLVLSKRLVTNFDLEEAKVDEEEGEVFSAAEFVLHKLKEMGKINEEDISFVLKEFETLEESKISGI
ncbi:hypothetical protein ACFE04_007772 [Oxalis oulophora]